MSLTVTFATVCDNCGVLVEHKTQVIEDELDVPRNARILGMDLCKDCYEEAAQAIRAVLEPLKFRARYGRRCS